jgi:hypothetical protein
LPRGRLEQRQERNGRVERDIREHRKEHQSKVEDTEIVDPSLRSFFNLSFLPSPLSFSLPLIHPSSFQRSLILYPLRISLAYPPISIIFLARGCEKSERRVEQRFFFLSFILLPLSFRCEIQPQPVSPSHPDHCARGLSRTSIVSDECAYTITITFLYFYPLSFCLYPLEDVTSTNAITVL